ncbi:MAG: DUF547 domain-containing protein [bacterium]|nr:DUF547 domain-containing protein [bacterium]
MIQTGKYDGKLLWCLVVVFILGTFEVPVFASEKGAHRIDYATLDRVLETFVDLEGRVDYAGLKAHPEDLKRFTFGLAHLSPESHPEAFESLDARKAYWLNAYNALVLQGIVEAFPVKSVRDIDGFFDRISYTVGGKRFTLNHIEHEILRKEFADPRVHAAINCASVGCPRLPRKAFRPESLAVDLEESMRAFVLDPQHVRVDRAKGKLFLSKIFDWFQGDFTGWYAGKYNVKNAAIVDYIKPYLSDGDRAFLTDMPDVNLVYMKYDWALNDQASSLEQK